MTNSNDTLENRTRDLPVCSAMPQPTAPSPAPVIYYIYKYTCMCLTYYVHLVVIKKKQLTVRIQGGERFKTNTFSFFTVFCVQGTDVGSSNHWPCTFIFVYESVL
jgi:hypothetical protein